MRFKELSNNVSRLFKANSNSYYTNLLRDFTGYEVHVFAVTSSGENATYASNAVSIVTAEGGRDLHQRITPMTILQQKHKTLPRCAYHEKSSHPRIILTLVTATLLIKVTTLAIAKILVTIKTLVKFSTLSVTITTLVRATVLVIQCSHIPGLV